tara:strand:- start:232 stop:684 length:453 start_codon:yes stop_codon:yes gene_type:complete
MKITCDVIRDLLPLYHDDICSNDSKNLVEAHIERCETCREELEKYRTEIIGGTTMNHTENINEAQQIENIAKAWKRDKKVSFLSGATLISLMASIGSILAYNAHGSYVGPDGMLVEAFGFIPLSFLFAFISIICGASLGILMLVRKLKRS